MKSKSLGSSNILGFILCLISSLFSKKTAKVRQLKSRKGCILSKSVINKASFGKRIYSSKKLDYTLSISY